MNSPYLVSNAARFDFDEIMQHTADTAGLEVAAKVHAEIERGFQRIGSRPHLVGHIRRDVPDKAVRAMRVYSYLIFYLPNTDPVMILRIIHGARDIPVAYQERT